MTILNEGYKSSKFFFNRGYKSIIYDKKNNRYFDLTSAGGTSLLGHNNNIFKKALSEFSKNNYSNFALPNEHAERLSKKIKKILPQFSKFIFCNSGAEANLKAIRIARAVSKKDKIVNISGSWHGSIDQFLFSKDIKSKKIKLSHGLEKGIEKKLIFAPYNNFKETKKILDKNKKKICCVMFEPIQGCLPTENNLNYIKEVSKYCRKKKIILLLDEIITGLRTNCSSVQNKYKLHSDISTFGKAFGNSLPIGFIGISKKIERKILKQRLKIFFGGTFSGNSLSTFTSDKTLSYLLKNKKKIFENLENKSSKFCENINSEILKKNLNAKVIRFQSVIRIIFSKKDPKDRVQRDFLEKKNNSNRVKFIKFLKNKKIIFPSNGIIFLNNSISSKEIQYLSKIIVKGLSIFFK